MENNEQRTRSFNPQEHLIQLKSKAGSQDYLPVQFRLVWYRTECPLGTIDTEEVEVNLDRVCEVETYVWNAEKRRSEKVIKQAKGYARFKAVVTDGRGGRATGTKSECAANFPDYIEKAESGAIGRALAALGYGTQFAPEFAEEDRIVDAPVDNPADIDKLRTRWGNAYDIPDDTFEVRWGKYKVYILGKNIADPDLTGTHRRQINDDLLRQEKQNVEGKKAS